jgi:hypothetical protein
MTGTHFGGLLAGVFLAAILTGCAQGSDNDDGAYCAEPAPLGGEPDPAAPGYLVFLADGIDVTSEATRFVESYGIEVGAVWNSLNGFFAEMSDDARERIRCEESVLSLLHNGIIVTLPVR